eukprot:TRINITY_DN3558_c0_g1_i1.p1 TRINITY_DN3558_c0_g1~~TRINITY_DN3558_c0_g1_i1.p1  ORF type:complete len:520 (+),score=113.60 TRINITY_DN3558_c0_g1_i1:59-1561(+)
MTDSAIAAPPSDHTLLNASIIQAAASLIGCGNAVAIARLISRTPIPAGDGLLSHLALGGAGHFRQPPIPLLAAALEHFQQLVRLRSDQLLEKEDALKLLIDAVHLYQRNTRLLLAPAIGKIKPALESDLIAVALRYHSVVAQEEKQVEQELEAESIACKRQSEQLTAALYFGLFGAHVERETASAVKFRKLQPSNPMFVRCKQAAIGNVKDGFFTGSAVTGLDVVDVFKIDNKPARARFHQVASMFEPSQTKGLFSLIPVNSIERLVVLGVGAPGMDRADVFPPHWSSSGTEDESYVDGVLKQCRMLPMPLVCSRYSTLEHGRPSARPTSVASSRRMSEADLDANAGRDFHYLILSRVVLGNMALVEDAPSNVLRGYDCAYCPVTEEYYAFDQRHVLPEFLLQCRYVTAEDSDRETMSHGLSQRAIIDHRDRALRVANVKTTAALADLKAIRDSVALQHNAYRKAMLDSLRAEAEQLKTVAEAMRHRTQGLAAEFRIALK